MAAMDVYCGSAVSYRVPEGSFYLWVEMDPQFDWTGVRAKCLEQGVYYRPGEMFATDQSSRQYFRLAFSYLPEGDIEEGIRILGQVLSENQRTAVIGDAEALDVGTEDDTLHQPTSPHPWWTETFWLSFGIPERRMQVCVIGGFARTSACRPVE